RPARARSAGPRRPRRRSPAPPAAYRSGTGSAGPARRAGCPRARQPPPPSAAGRARSPHSRPTVERSASATSAIRVRLGQEVLDIAAHAFFQRGRLAAVAEGADAIHAGLGEVLIAIADRLGHVDIGDGRLLARRRE